MSDKLKPLGDKAKALFAAFGLDGAAAQQAIQKAAQPKGKKEVVSRLLVWKTTSATDPGISNPSAVVASRTFDMATYKPEAYVIFIRRNTCKGCKAQTQTHDSNTLFLRYVHRTRSDSKLYMPAKMLDLPSLPRIRETIISVSPVCFMCFEEASCLGQETYISPLPILVSATLETDSTKSSRLEDLGPASSFLACEAESLPSPEKAVQTHTLDGIPSGFVGYVGPATSPSNTKASGTASQPEAGCTLQECASAPLSAHVPGSDFHTEKPRNAHDGTWDDNHQTWDH